MFGVIWGGSCAMACPAATTNPTTPAAAIAEPARRISVAWRTAPDSISTVLRPRSLVRSVKSGSPTVGFRPSSVKSGARTSDAKAKEAQGGYRSRAHRTDRPTHLVPQNPSKPSDRHPAGRRACGGIDRSRQSRRPRDAPDRRGPHDCRGGVSRPHTTRRRAGLGAHARAVRRVGEAAGQPDATGRAGGHGVQDRTYLRHLPLLPRLAEPFALGPGVVGEQPRKQA